MNKKFIKSIIILFQKKRQTKMPFRANFCTIYFLPGFGAGAAGFAGVVGFPNAMFASLLREFLFPSLIITQP